MSDKKVLSHSIHP